MRNRQQIVFACRAGATHRGPNASPLFGYFLIGDAGAAELKFIGAVAGENQVGMCIHKAGRNHTSFGVDDLGIFGKAGFDLAARSYRFDFAATDEHGSVANDRQLAHLRSGTWTVWAGQREQLRTVHQRRRVSRCRQRSSPCRCRYGQNHSLSPLFLEHA